jgi:hypothetical protein
MVIAVSGKVARPLFPRRKRSRRRHSAPRQMTQRVHRNMPQITSSARLITERERRVSPSASLRRPSVRPAISHTHTHTLVDSDSSPSRQTKTIFIIFMSRLRWTGCSAQHSKYHYHCWRSLLLPSACALRDRRLRLNASEPLEGIHAGATS